jgi:hypothetical protein
VGSYSLSDTHIFLPDAGDRYGSDLDSAGLYGNYWSSSLDGDYYAPCYAYYLYFDSGNVRWYYGYFRCSGKSVRGVCE